MAAPKFGTLVPNRIFVGGISASTSEAELTQLFSAYGNVKATKIISDRAGVSKGYGFVTFETDEEARRLQQESECIILRERKLNIAPAIKKQSFNRPFDGGSGSPAAVPTSAYYYANGMGLTYQNGLTFYNTGAAASGTAIAAPTDSATIYQTAGVFGPQAPSSHQTFAPVVYSCPTPSLYMPQQYQYSPLTYESYYAGTPAGGGPPQYALYATNAGTNQHEQQQSQSSLSNGCIGGNGGGSNVGGGRGNSTNASSPSTLAPLQPQPGQFYAPSGAPPPPHHHHHAPVASGPLPPQPQLDHLYYSFPAPGPPPVPPQPQHQTIGIGEQQLLLYTTDPTSCQQITTTPDNQAAAQEDTRTTSSTSDEPRQRQRGELYPSTSRPLVSLMPVKYSIMPGCYPNYRPMGLHFDGVSQSSTRHGRIHDKSENNSNGTTGSDRYSLNSTTDQAEVDDTQSPSSTRRSESMKSVATTFLYSTTFYVPHEKAYTVATCPTGERDIFPVPNATYDSPIKVHQPQSCYVNPGIGIDNTFGIGSSYQRTHSDHSLLDGIQQPTCSKNQIYTRKYGNYQGVVNSMDGSRHCDGRTGLMSQRYTYLTPKPAIFGLNGKILSNLPRLSFNATTISGYNGQNYLNSRGTWCDQSSDPYNSRRRDSSFHSRKRSRENYSSAQTDGNLSVSSVRVINDSKAIVENREKNAVVSGITVTNRNRVSPGAINRSNNNINNNNNNNNSPPPAPYSPMTRPFPNISPPISQVQFYATGPQAQSRYHQQQVSHHQQQLVGQRRFPVIGQSVTASRKFFGSGSLAGQGSGEHLRRLKNKVNDIGQGGVACKIQDDHCLGGGGDATGSNMVNRLPITPPPTPRTHGSGAATVGNVNTVNNDTNVINDTCHQMQALSL